MRDDSLLPVYLVFIVIQLIFFYLLHEGVIT
jgi:hypothetical protein